MLTLRTKRSNWQATRMQQFECFRFRQYLFFNMVIFGQNKHFLTFSASVYSIIRRRFVSLKQILCENLDLWDRDLLDCYRGLWVGK